MWRERLVLPGRQKRRRNEGNERISRFLLRSEGGVLGCFWQTAQERQPMVQRHAVKSYSYPTYTSSAYRVTHRGVRKRAKKKHIMCKPKHAAAGGIPLGDSSLSRLHTVSAGLHPTSNKLFPLHAICPTRFVLLHIFHHTFLRLVSVILPPGVLRRFSHVLRRPSAFNTPLIPYPPPSTPSYTSYN